MSTDHEPPKDIYRRLVAQGTPEKEIEQVYRKLRKAGYGEKAARERLEATLRRLREERARASRGARSRSARPGEDDTGSPVGGAAAERRRGTSRGESGEAGRPARRMEDWFPEVPPRLRRRVNKWAYQQKLMITGLRERWLDFLSYFRPSAPDLVNPRLLGALGRRRHYLTDNPYGYSLATTLDALYSVSRTFLGRSGGNRDDERAVGDAMRRRDPFAYEYLSRFSYFDETLRQSLAYIELAYDNNTDLPVAALARVTRETWRLAMSTERVSRAKVENVFGVAGDVLLAYGKHPQHGLSLDDLQSIFLIGLENLQRYKEELYPVVLKAVKSFYEASDDSPEKRNRILEFLELADDEILTVKGFYQEQERKKEQMLAEQQMLQVESVEREKEAGFSHRFGEVLSILDALFPYSGVRDMERWEFLIPFFDQRVFVNSLPFDHGPHSVEVISRFDPLQPVLVMHRIVDNLLSSVDHVRLEAITGQHDVAENLGDIKADWAEVYDTLFTPYLKSLNDYARGISDEEYARPFSQTSAARTIEQEVGVLRNRTIRNYGQAVVRSGDQSATRLWSIVERLTLVLGEVGEHIHQDISKRKDPVSKRIYEELGKAPVIDFKEHATPGTARFKPVIRQLRRYIEAKYHSSLSSVPRVAQLFHLDLLRGVAELYRHLLNDEESFLRAAGGRIMLAGDEEKAAWKRERDSRGDLTEQLRIRLDEHLVSEYTDALTGLRTKNFYLQKLPTAYEKLARSGKPLSVLMIDIDHFKWVNDELGHQKGDDVLRDAATTILDGTRRGSDIAIRYGGEEIMVVTPVPLHTALTLAERLRFAQAKHLNERDLYAPVASIGEERGEPCGTFSIGVVERADGESLEQFVERADKALYESKTGRNTVTAGHAKPVAGKHFERFSDYAARVRKTQQKPEPREQPGQDE
jgi:diguanylate cyclase (GGDEF)-like protein